VGKSDLVCPPRGLGAAQKNGASRDEHRVTQPRLCGAALTPLKEVVEEVDLVVFRSAENCEELGTLTDFAIKVR
jgi:hypothetical protein